MECLPKLDKFSDILRRCTELGVQQFVPCISERVDRKEQSKKRLLIDTSIVSNNAFYNKLTKNDWFNSSKIVASFLSIKSEISTNTLNQYLLSLGKILCLPIIENNEKILIFKRYCIGNELKKGKFGVREPVNSQSYLPDRLRYSWEW